MLDLRFDFDPNRQNAAGQKGAQQDGHDDHDDR